MCERKISYSFSGGVVTYELSELEKNRDNLSVSACNVQQDIMFCMPTLFFPYKTLSWGRAGGGQNYVTLAQ